jgi:hypothetical protein
MAHLSVGDAAGAGFKLIGGKPLSVFAWGLFAIVLGVLPVMAMMGTSMTPFMDMVRDMKLHPGVQPSHEQMMHMYGNMMFVNPLARLASLVVKTMLAAAVFRAVLEPRKNAFAYLRISMQEVWILLVSIVEMILVGVGVVVALIVCGLIVGVVASSATKMAAGLTGVVLAVICVVALIWVLLRLSMATPMSFEERGFRLFESWKITRGHAFGLFLLALLIGVILLLLELAALVVIGIPMMLIFHPHAMGPEAIQAFMKQPPQMMLQTVGPVIVVCVLVFSFVIGALQAIVLAPWATAYRMLRPAQG